MDAEFIPSKCCFQQLFLFFFMGFWKDGAVCLLMQNSNALSHAAKSAMTFLVFMCKSVYLILQGRLWNF